MNQLQDKFNTLGDELNTYVFERRDEVEGMLIAVLSKQHVFLLGAPGTAKSWLLRLLTKQTTGARYFERLITAFTQPDELFGAVSIKGLKNDQFIRKVDGKLPDVHFAFLDEVWKGNSSCLNSLLKVINEREYDNDGTVVKCPLITMFGASNELPEDRDILGAMWDRFLLKYEVKYIREDSTFIEMIRGGEAPKITTTISLKEVEQAQAEVDAVTIPDDVYEAVVGIRRELKRQGIEPSDRRYKWALKAIKARAWLNGRDRVTVDDLSILVPIMWDVPEDMEKVDRIVIGLSNPYQREADELMDAIWSVRSEVEKADEDDRPKISTIQISGLQKAVKALKSVKKKMESEDRNISGHIPTVLTLVIDLR